MPRDNPLPAIWSSTETNVGIICSCLPTLRGCVARVFPRFFPSANSGRNTSGRGTRGTGRSQQGRQDTSPSGTAIELAGERKSIRKSGFQFWESEQSVARAEFADPNPEIQRQYNRSGQTWLQDASSKEEFGSRESDDARQHGKALSSYQVV